MFSMNKMSLGVLLAVLSFTLLAPGAGALGADEVHVSYRVDVTDPESGEIAVALEVETSSAPLLLEMADDYGDVLATDLSSHVVGERAVDDSGNDLPFSRDGNTWSIDHSGRLTFSYKVRMDDYQAGTSYLESLSGSGAPWPYFPLLEPELAYLPGYAVFVRPLGPDCIPSLELELPQSWQAALPWREQPSGMDDLLNNPLFAGRLALLERGSLLAAVPVRPEASSAAGLEDYAAKAQSLLEKAESLLGGLGLEEGHRLVLALLFHGGEKSTQDVYYPSSPFSSSVVIPDVEGADPLTDAAIETTARGMASLLLSRELSVESETLWLREGVSWYMQDLLPYEGGLWGAALFWDRFNLHYDTYREARADFAPSMAEAGAMGYESEGAAVMLTCGGAAACASFDSELRSMEPYTMDLATFVRNLYELGESEEPLRNDDISAALTSLTGRDWSSFFRDYIEGDLEIPASSFSSLNIAEPGSSSLPLEDLDTEASTSDWILIIVAALVVFLIPFVLEPYTMRPRKPGFLEKEMAKDDED